MGRDVGERDVPDLVRFDRRSLVASIDFAALDLRLAEPSSGRFAHHDALFSPASPVVDTPPTLDVAGLPRWNRCARSPLAVRVVHRDGRFRLWRLLDGGVVDLGEHILVAIPFTSVSAGHLAHHGR